MKLSPLVARMRPSQISEIFDRAVELRAQGRDLVDFSVGEPDFDTPQAIREAGQRAIDDGHTRYTGVDGTPALKDAVIEKFRRDQGLDFERSQIVVGNGAKPVLAAAVAVVAGAGDEVILPTPAWPSHIGMIDAAGANLVRVPTTQDEAYKLTASKLEAAITARSRLLILSSPANPTGAVYSTRELEALAEVLRAHPDLAILSDDLYEHIVFDGREFVTMAQIAPDLQTRILTVNGVSKAYAMTGWRIGYAGGAKDWARAIAGYFSQTNGSPCAISQRAAIEALSGSQDFLVKWRQIYQKRRDLFLDILQGAPLLKAYRSEGAFYVFVDVSDVLGMKAPDGGEIKTDQDFVAHLLEAGVVVTPGSAFESEGAMRISIATSEAEIEKGATRIVEAVKALQP